MTQRKLDVYLRSTCVGNLVLDDEANLSFTYLDEYLASENACEISVSMPLASTTYPNSLAKPFFSGLLPDESARIRLARALGVSDTNAFGMLEIIGGDCAGALALYAHNQDIDRLQGDDEVLTEAQLADVLLELPGNPLLGSRTDVRMSLAGAQDKLAVNLLGDQVVLVKNGEPTTHILKPAIEGLEGSAENEVFCMTLAKRVGLQVPGVAFSIANGTGYLLVERFDRTLDENGNIQRLHQEDFCQALSVPPELKYEDEGGPGINQSLELIQRVTNQPAANRLTFLKMVIFNFLVGNADAHAKNYALLHSIKPSAPRLAPLYDVVCTAAYPVLTKKFAMSVGGRNIPDTIRLKHWLTLMPEARASQRLLIKELTALAESIVQEATTLQSEADALGFGHPILRNVVQTIQTRSHQILEQASALSK